MGDREFLLDDRRESFFGRVVETVTRRQAVAEKNQGARGRFRRVGARRLGAGADGQPAGGQ